MSKIASERSFNNSMFYINKVRDKNNEYPILGYKMKKIKGLSKKHKNYESIKCFESSDILDKTSYKILDLISDYFLKCYYKIDDDGNYSIPTTPYDDIVFSNKKFVNLVEKNIPIDVTFSDDEFLYLYKDLLPKFKKSDLFYYLNKLGQCKLKLEYNYRVLTTENDENKFTYEKLNNINDNDEPVSIFTPNIIDSFIGKNGNVYERLYKLDFSSWLGLAFIENLKNINIDYINEEYYSNMTHNHFMFYKFFILPNCKKKNPCKKISIWEIRERMGLKPIDKNYIVGYIENSLDYILKRTKSFKKYELQYDQIKIYF